jgi:hypothetical protein
MSFSGHFNLLLKKNVFMGGAPFPLSDALLNKVIIVVS